jgi:hypothetical protein
LPIVDATGYLVFDTIIGLHDVRNLVTLDDVLEAVAAAGHQQILAGVSSRIRPSLDLMIRREGALINALRLRQARLSAGLLQPGLFDRRAERAAAARASVVDDAVQRSAVHVSRLHRLDHLRADSRAIVFGIAFR